MAISNCLPESETGAPAPFLLWYIGPTLYVEIGYDAQYQAGQIDRPDLPSELFPALLDTGARESCIDTSLAQDLGLPFEGQKLISGTYGTHLANVYLAQIYIPALDETISGEFYGITMAGGGFYQRALICRDFLLRCVLHYDGRTGEVTISND